MIRLKMAGLVLVLSYSLAAVRPVEAGGTDFGKFPLTKAIPADVFVAVAAKSNPERQFLNDYWGEVKQAFWDSGIATDVWDMMADTMSDEHLEQMEAIQQQFSTLCKEVQWGDLFDKEMIHVGRMIMPQGQMASLYEGAMLGRMTEKAAAANYQSLKSLMGEIVKFADAKGGEGVIKLVETKVDGLVLAGIMPQGMPGPMLCVGHHEDVIAVSFGGQKIMIDCFDLLRGKGEAKQLIKSERFQKAFASLPAAEDELFFFDPPAMFGPVSKLLKMFAGQGAPKSEAAASADGDGEEPAAGAEAAGDNTFVTSLAKLLDDVSIFDHIAGVEWTDGFSVRSQTITTLKADAKKSPLYGVLATKPAGGAYDKYVPKEATTFSCSSGISLSKLYHYVRDFVGEAAPEGEQMLVEFDRMQKEDWELNIEKDILDLFDGPIISITMGSDWLLMLKVTDEAAANARVKTLFARVNDALGQEQSVQLTPVEIYGAKFTQLSHPMMMMMGGLAPPVIGCAEGHLVIGSSTKAVERCLKTAAGKHPSILKNKRFMKEGLNPSKGEEVDAISFTDESNTAQELQQAIGIMSMVMGFAGMGMQDAPPQAQAIMQSIPPILAKLGPIAGKLDFYQSSAQVSTFDGQRWVTRGVQNYKEPRPEEETEEVEDGETADE